MKTRGFAARALALLPVLMLLVVCLAPAGAAELPDADRTGSIRLTLKHGEETLTEGKLTLYRVGEIREEDGNFSYALTGEFTGCGLSLEKLSDGRLAENLARYAREHHLTGTDADLDREGTARFETLQAGLYLIVQKKGCEGYYPLTPFLVSLPCQVDGEWVYDVDAAPKTQLRPKPEPTPVTPETPEEPEKPGLPQTGQLNWPLPWLTLGGLVLFALGWNLYFGKGRGANEK